MQRFFSISVRKNGKKLLVEEKLLEIFWQICWMEGFNWLSHELVYWMEGFNWLSHELVIAKQNSYGFSFNTLKSVQSYLSNS